MLARSKWAGNCQGFYKLWVPKRLIKIVVGSQSLETLQFRPPTVSLPSRPPSNQSNPPIFQVWFKNRRAKNRQQQKTNKTCGDTASNSSDSPPPEPKAEMKLIPMPPIPLPGTAEFNATNETKYMSTLGIKKEPDFTSTDTIKYDPNGEPIVFISRKTPCSRFFSVVSVSDGQFQHPQYLSDSSVLWLPADHFWRLQ